jgi:hypothetical protein
MMLGLICPATLLAMNVGSNSESGNLHNSGPAGVAAATHGSPATATATATTTTVQVSTSFYDFGDNIVGNSLNRSVVEVTNTGKVALTMQPVISGDSS